MAAKRTQTRNTRNTRNRMEYTDTYQYDNTVRKLDVKREIEEEAPTKRRVSLATRKNREKATRMSLGHVIFLSMALIVTTAILINYIRLQADNIEAVKAISQKENQLNSMKLENEETYSRVISSVDLDEVKRIAMDELGMQYAKEGQIVKVEDASDDYVRQHNKMP